MDCMRVVRSGVMDANLVQKYPELPTLIQRSRQARIDAINLNIKDLDYYRLGGGFGKSTDDPAPIPLQSRRRNQPQSGTRAQELPASTSVENQGFAHQHSSLGSNVLPKESPQTRSGPQSPETVESPTARLKGNHSMEENVAYADTRSSVHAGLAASSAPKSAHPPKEYDHGIDRPWGSTGLTMGKLNMKQIMDQASSSKTSSLSLGLQAEVKSQEKQTGSFGMKISQKQRKRQHQSVEQPGEASRSPSQPSVAPTAASPWKPVSKPTKASGESLVTTPAMPIKPESQSRSTSTPQLTMRQTIANSPTPSKGSARTNTSMKPEQRSVSTPQRDQKTSPVSDKVSTDPQSTSVRSIRYQHNLDPATPSHNLAYGSLADIISQEEAGKAAIKDAVAKRSLQEIQQEQEFQVSVQ